MAIFQRADSMASSDLEQLQHELEYSRVLVDVTNTVIAKRDLNELAQELADEMRNFFAIRYISLDLFDFDNSQLRCYTADFHSDAPTTSTQDTLPLNSVLLSSIINYKDNRLLQCKDLLPLAQDDNYIQRLVDSGLATFCLLPLIFNDKILGVLGLGNDQRDIFSDYNLALFQQIAARISIGIDNASAYQEISRLKDNLLKENQYLSEEIKNFENFDEIIGESSAMAEVLEQVEMVAASDCTVLILGETGTGKELIARAIHRLSQRSNNTMVKINCAAIPSGLLESDLFGHEKGAFTGANSQRIGRFELANNGTLFLDEVGDIPLELQPKLLRVLQEREIERLGSNKVIPVNVRLIAATNCDLQQMVLDRQYRSDLYYRLNVFPIVIPPLRQRPEDIPLLVKFFTKKISRRMNRHIDSIPTDVLQHMSQLPWPGNIRELENIVERAVILSRGNVLNISLENIAPSPAVSKPQVQAVTPIIKRPTKSALADDSDLERQQIITVLKETNGIVAGPKGAAERLGLKRTTLLSRMQRLGISVKDIQDD